MNTNFEKRKRHLLLGIFGCPLFTLLLAHNLYLLILPPVYWAYLTVLMKYTEEK